MSSTNITTVRVWDPLVRIFHWSLVLSFTLAYLTEDDWMSLHVQAGYAVSLLIAFRLIWGLIGTKPARFSSFVKPPRMALTHLKKMRSGKAEHYLGHNPAAALMIVALLSSIVITAFTGMITIASEGQGPLANTLFASWPSDWFEEIHEFFANCTVFLIVMHITGVLISSLLEGENLVRAMITGSKKYRNNWQDKKQGSGK